MANWTVEEREMYTRIIQYLMIVSIKNKYNTQVIAKLTRCTSNRFSCLNCLFCSHSIVNSCGKIVLNNMKIDAIQDA